MDRQLVTVRCVACMHDGVGCPFKDLEWPIAVWPKLKPTKAGMERRLREVEKKGPVPKKTFEAGPSEMVRSRSEGSQTAGPSGTVRDEPFRSTQTRASGSTTQAPSQNWSKTATREERFYFESLVSYEAPLLDPSSSSIFLGSAIVEVESAILRDADAVRRLSSYVNFRRQVLDRLFERLRDACNLAEQREERRYQEAVGREAGAREEMDKLEGDGEEKD